jgi:hypothetical protein
MRFYNIFRGFSQCNIGDGLSVCFWEDNLSNSVLAFSNPRLASFALNSAASVKEILEAHGLESIFTLPLSQEALQELDHLQSSIPELELNEDTPDQWKPTWRIAYTAKNFY